MKKETCLPPIRMSEVQKVKVEEKAEKMGMNLSEYIRWLIMKDLEG